MACLSVDLGFLTDTYQWVQKMMGIKWQLAKLNPPSGKKANDSHQVWHLVIGSRTQPIPNRPKFKGKDDSLAF